jgi:hypothetical protein
MVLRVNPLTLEAVAKTLPRDIGLTPRQLNERLPDVPRRAICDALLILVRANRASFRGEITQRRYFSGELQT